MVRFLKSNVHHLLVGSYQIQNLLILSSCSLSRSSGAAVQPHPVSTQYCTSSPTGQYTLYLTFHIPLNNIHAVASAQSHTTSDMSHLLSRPVMLPTEHAVTFSLCHYRHFVTDGVKSQGYIRWLRWKRLELSIMLGRLLISDKKEQEYKY